VEELAGLGLTEEEVSKIGIGHKIVDMPNTEMAEHLITSKKTPPRNNKNKTAKANGPRGAGAGPGVPEPPKGREGYTIF
jgi:hypothetical protein